MNTFEAAGEYMQLVQQGQREMAASLAAWLRGLGRELGRGLGRVLAEMPEGSLPQ